MLSGKRRDRCQVQEEEVKRDSTGGKDTESGVKRAWEGESLSKADSDSP